MDQLGGAIKLMSNDKSVIGVSRPFNGAMRNSLNEMLANNIAFAMTKSETQTAAGAAASTDAIHLLREEVAAGRKETTQLLTTAVMVVKANNEEGREQHKMTRRSRSAAPSTTSRCSTGLLAAAS